MAETLRALGEILLQALPTFFLVILLFLYLNAVFFKPMAKVLEQRRQATEGAREAAKQSLDRAAERTGVYEASLRAERAEVYKEQEEQRRRWREQQTQEIQSARKQIEAQVAAAKVDLNAQAAQAKQSLAANSQTLANEIVEMILHRRPA